MRTHKQLSGILQIGQGKESPLMGATVTNPYGSTESVEVLVSAEDRHVWLRLDAESARKLRDQLTAVLESQK